MKLKYIDKETREDGLNRGKYFEYNKEYPIEDKERAKELLESGLFEEVKEEPKKKDIKEDTK